MSIYGELFREIAREEGWKIQSIGGDWIFSVERDGKTALVYGYRFPLNSDASSLLASDKAGCAEFLQSRGIPLISHELVPSPLWEEAEPEEGVLTFLLDRLRREGELVLKDNCGTGGNDVYRVRSERELLQSLTKLFSRKDGLSVSPFVAIREEYRSVLLDGECRVFYRKERARDESGRLLEWRHNLGQGARAVLMDPLPECLEICRRVMKELGLRFASVDLVETEEGELKLLEVNSGVMMDHLSMQGEKERKLVKEILRDALRLSMEGDRHAGF